MASQPAIRMVVHPTPVVLPEGSSLRRNPPRPVAQRQPGYLEKFDADTLFYDIFHGQHSVILSGPPLLNLKAEIDAAAFTTDSGEVVQASLNDADRTQASSVAAPPRTAFLNFSVGDQPFTGAVHPSLLSVFDDKNVLFTKSKNNRLRWIHDWVKFHVRHQLINGVLIYDNGSTDYRPEDVLECIGGIAGVETAVVVSWPFKFGPQGGSWEGLKNAPWDSDFSEYGIIEHARHRFLANAHCVISADIDELVISEDDEPVVKKLEKSEHSVLSYVGRWIEATSPGDVGIPSFTDFLYYDSRRGLATPKWSACPQKIPDARQWRTHNVLGVPMETTELVRHRHFMGITTNWKFDRTSAANHWTQAAITGGQHLVLDQKLKDTLADLDPLAVDVAPGGRPSTATTDVSGQRLIEIREQLLAAEQLPQPLIREWFHSPLTLVLDYLWAGEGIAFDIRADEEAFSVTLVGRRPSARAYVASLMKGFGRAVAQPDGKFVVARVSAHLPTAELAREILAAIAAVYAAAANAVRETDPIKESEVPAYWWDDRTNFGDLLAPWVVELVTGRRAHNTRGRPGAGDALVSVGSLINQLERPGLDIWGSGVIAALRRDAIARLRTRKPRKIHAVRGWLTRRELITGLGWEVPEVFGDPALLLPRFFSPPTRAAAGETLVIPHYQHKALFAGLHDDAARVVDVERDAMTVVSEIAGASRIIATSLHGIIIAHAYGVPWTWLAVGDLTLAGDQFKFEDFFTVLDRQAVSQSVAYQADIPELKMKPLADKATVPASRYTFDELLQAFPANFRG
jgi:hypothetical protein